MTLIFEMKHLMNIVEKVETVIDDDIYIIEK